MALLFLIGMGVQAQSFEFQYKGQSLADGATVAVPNNTTNEARALLLLEQEGILKLKENAGITATVQDIEENPKNIEIKEIDPAQIARSLPDVDIARKTSPFLPYP